MKLILSLLSICSVLTISAQKAETFSNDPIQIKKYVLDNGLTVMLSENHELPKVFGSVMVKAGGKNDPKTATGLAHYLEHMLFKGTQTMGTIDFAAEKPHLDSINDLYEQLGFTKDDSARVAIQRQINAVSVRAAKYAIPNEIDKILSEMGATGVNAFTSEEMTVYHNTFPSHQMEKWLDVYSHRFEKPVFRLFQAELETVYEEKNKSADNPGSKGFEEFLKAFYKVHPYGQQPLIGFTEHLKNPPLKKMYEYFNQYYVANNMLLVLAGDFVADSVIKDIEEKFGDWRTGEVPTFPEYKEEEFKGREYLSGKYTPIKLGFMGYRTPANGTKEAIAVEVMGEMLSNSASSGLLDQVSLDGEIMFAQLSPMNYNDYGASLVLFAPKIVGQKFEEAEAIIKDQFRKLREGDFTNAFLEATKQNLLNDIETGWESNYYRCMQMMQSFSEGTDWSEFVQKEAFIKSLTKKDIQEIASKYYNENYLILESKMGSSKNEKLKKPPFEPVVNKNEVRSEYFKYLESVPSAPASLEAIDFNKAVETVSIGNQNTLRKTENPYNDMFELSLIYGKGSESDPIYEYLAAYLNYSGADSLSSNEYRALLFDLGTKVQVFDHGNEFVVFIEGPDKNLEESVVLLNRFMNSFPKSESVLKKVYNDKKSMDKFENDDPQHLSSVLTEYAKFGDKSDYLNTLSLKDLKKMEVSAMEAAYNGLMKHEVVVDYVGNRDIDEVSKLLLKKLTLPEGELKAPMGPRVRKFETTNNIYFYNKKNAVQTQIRFVQALGDFDPALTTDINAFNQYFGANMSSLVFQEIREFRSLAYTANARVIEPGTKEGQIHMSGYIGCQADKTIDAITAMMDLFRKMPAKPERMEMMRSAMINKTMTSKPSFRYLASRIEYWKQKGYDVDPRVLLLEHYKTMKFDDILAFYNAYVKDATMLMTVLGDEKRFDKEALSQFGNIVEVKKKDILLD